MSSDGIILRPHHGMCMAFFVGLGYSDGFSDHMSALLDALAPDTPVRLTVGTDDVCSTCPNNVDGVCKDAELTARYDRAVLSLCGLREGQCLPFGAFTQLVQTRILSLGLRRDVCGGCRWERVCDCQPSRWR